MAMAGGQSPGNEKVEGHQVVVEDRGELPPRTAQVFPSSDFRPGGWDTIRRMHPSLIVVCAATFLFQCGEELWQQFRSLYLRALGADARLIGVFGTAEDVLDGIYQYPGGWVADHLGRRSALLMFCALPLVGYALYFGATSWVWIFVGLPFVMAWGSMASPSIFATVGDTLPKNQRALGFVVQSVVRRVPSLIAPPLGGLLIDRLAAAHASHDVGVVMGVRVGLAITMGLALVTLIVLWRMYVELRPQEPPVGGMAATFRAMHRSLKALLLSDIFIRMCEGIGDVFLVLYARDVVGVSGAAFGGLVALARGTSILSYIPGSRADALGRRGFTLLTFIFFTLFPLCVALSHTMTMLVVAFLINGLHEIGEPARKAMIVDFADPTSRGRTIGLYYFIRSVAIAPAATVGGLLYQAYGPAAPFFAAFGFGVIGTVIFAVLVAES